MSTTGDESEGGGKCNVTTSSDTCVMRMHVSVCVNNTNCVHVCSVAMVTV